MCLRGALEKYIAGAALDRAGLDNVGCLISYSPVGLHGLLRGQLKLANISKHLRSSLALFLDVMPCSLVEVV
jgi:hypothetical protein